MCVSHTYDWLTLESLALQLPCATLHTCVVVCCSVLQCVAVCCSLLQCVAVGCSGLQVVTVCCIGNGLRLEGLGLYRHPVPVCTGVLHCVAVYFSMLQCVALVMCGSVLQCVAVCCSMLQCVTLVMYCLCRDFASHSTTQYHGVPVCCIELQVLQCVASVMGCF